MVDECGHAAVGAEVDVRRGLLRAVHLDGDGGVREGELVEDDGYFPGVGTGAVRVEGQAGGGVVIVGWSAGARRMGGWELGWCWLAVVEESR